MVIGCVFAGNSAIQQGGGITLEFSSEPIIIDCIVEGNSARTGGGVACTQTSNGTFEDCVITGNVAIEGAGFFASGSSPLLISVTLSGNRSSQLGGGISSVAGASPGMSQCVVWGNCALGGADSGNELYIDPLSNLVLACCALDSSGVGGLGQPEYAGSRNVFSDPLFCDPVNCLVAPTDEGDYRLDAQSPCLPEASPCDLLIGALGGPCWEGVTRRQGRRR
jgi:parallel beta-helix repeat protein